MSRTPHLGRRPSKHQVTWGQRARMVNIQIFEFLHYLRYVLLSDFPHLLELIYYEFSRPGGVRKQIPRDGDWGRRGEKKEQSFIQVIGVFLPDGPVLIHVCHFEVHEGHPPVEDPFGKQLLGPFCFPLREVEEELGEADCAGQDPDNGENSPFQAGEALVSIAQRRDGGADAVEGVNGAQLLDLPQENLTRGHQQHQEGRSVEELVLGSVRPNLLHDSALLMLPRKTQRPGQQCLLLLHEVVRCLAQEKPYQGHPSEHEGAGEELCQDALRHEVSIADGGHRHNAEVHGIDDSHGLRAPDLVLNH